MLATIPDCSTEAEERAEAEYLARMHRVNNDEWKARGWIPAIY